MKTLVCGMLMCGVLASVCCRAYADDATDLTETYTAAGVPDRDHPAPSGLHGVLGAGLFNGGRIVGDDGRRTALIPLVLMRYDDVAYWSLGGGGVWLFHSEDRSIRLGAGIKLHPGWKPDDDPTLMFMASRRASLDGYVNAFWKTSPVNVGATYYHDIGDVSNGESATLRFSHSFRWEQRFSLTPSIAVEWLDSKLVDYYYGVRTIEALPQRPAYFGRDTVDFSAGLNAGYRLSRTWALLGGVHVTRFGGGITDSPIINRHSSTLVFFGAGWRF